MAAGFLRVVVGRVGLLSRSMKRYLILSQCTQSHTFKQFIYFAGFILLGLRGEEFEESFHLKLFMSVLFTFSEAHVWFTVIFLFIHIKLTGLLYVWIKLCCSSGRYRWRIYARSRFILIAMLYLSQNKVALVQDLPKQVGIPLTIFAPYSFPYRPDEGKWAH